MLLILRVTVGWYGILRVLLRVLFSEKSNMRVCAQTVTWRYTSHSRQQCCSARIKHCQRCFKNSYLVDPASSHMLVSKIKPCMSQYKLLYGETANGSLKQLSFIWWSFITWITMVILELIHAPWPDFVEGLCLLGTEPTQALPGLLVIHDNRTNRIASAGDGSFKFLTYQLPTVGYWPTVAMTGNGELGFDSGEGAWETATTSKEGSRRANYPILTQGGSDKK